MPAQDEAAVAAVELEHVDKITPVLFEREGPFFKWVDTAEDVEISNRDARVPLEVWPGGNFGHYNPDGGAMGLGSAPKYDKAVINSQHLKMGTQYTRKAEWATESGRKAVVNTVRRLSASAIAEFRRYLDSVLMTAGQGVLGTISAISNDGTDDTITFGTDGFGSKLVRYAQEVAIMSTDLAINRTGGTDKTINFHDVVAKTAKYPAASSFASATDKVVVGGLGNVTGSSVVSLLGVPYHHSSASSGTWLGLNRADYPQIRANQVDANSGTIALSYVRRAMNIIGDRVGMDNAGKAVAWMHPCQVQAIENLGWGLTTLPKTGGNKESLDLFFSVDQIAGIPIRKSFSWDKTRIDFAVKGVWKKVVFKKPGIYKKGSESLFDIRSTTDGSTKTSLVFYHIIGCNTYVNNPPLCSYINNLAVPTGY
ncbi:hypothetical protein LCGC14_0478040 [marine sediment metagenome]|uniref:Uncharacterized protein n=1 Tax=marine sediment metagenome TaxID=412755 RepID=A0A0F9SFI3_9ZZZZ